jgi:hypothetical protein
MIFKCHDNLQLKEYFPIFLVILLLQSTNTKLNLVLKMHDVPSSSYLFLSFEFIINRIDLQ